MFKSRYVFLALGLLLVSILAQSIYQQLNKKTTAKSLRLECHKRMTTFERVYDKKKLNEIKKLLKSGNVTIDSWVEKAKYSKSRLFEFVKLEDMNDVTKKVLKKYQESSVAKDEKKLKIEYYIYENDVDDPGKKTKRSKLYAGYVVFRFISDNELIYQVQVDFMDKKGLDIPNSIECAIKSFITI